MNKEYIYHDGNVILEDEKGNKKPVEYRDNLDEVLIQENIIEAMQIEKQELEEKSRNFQAFRKSYKRDVFGPFVTWFSAALVVNVIFNIFGNFDLEPFNTMIGPMTLETFITMGVSALGVFGGLPFTLFNYAEYREKLKVQNARKSSIEYLNRALEKAKVDLAVMKKHKTEETKKSGFRIVEINDSLEIRQLYEHIQLYYTCGYNAKKYYRYYQKHGQLPKKLIREYNEDDQQAIIGYLEEKGPTLVKKRVA